MSATNELNIDPLRDESSSRTAIEKLANRGTPAVAVVERPVVHVHANERVGLSAIKPARIAHGVIQRRRSVLQSICDTGSKVPRNLVDHLAAKVLANDVPSERKREPGFLEPPLAEVRDEVKAAIRER